MTFRRLEVSYCPDSRFKRSSSSRISISGRKSFEPSVGFFAYCDYFLQIFSLLWLTLVHKIFVLYSFTGSDELNIYRVIIFSENILKYRFQIDALQCRLLLPNQLLVRSCPSRRVDASCSSGEAPEPNNAGRWWYDILCVRRPRPSRHLGLLLAVWQVDSGNVAGHSKLHREDARSPSSQMHLSAKRIRRILQVCHDYCLRVILLFIATFISWDQQIIVILSNKKHHCTADWFNRTKLNIRTQNEVLGYQNGQIVNYLPIFFAN